MLRATHAEIHLENLRHNITQIRSRLLPTTKYMAVVKANAYGHGMPEVARYIEENGLAEHLAVAIAEEAFLLRDRGVKLPILILGPTFAGDIDGIIERRVTPTVFSADVLELLQRRAAQKNAVQPFHFKIDTGMNRIGFRDPDAFAGTLDLLERYPNLTLDGMFTHFAVSEQPDKSFTLLQAERFMRYVELARARGFSPLVHMCNSGAALELPELQADMVRGGIAMYGYHPIGHAVEQYPLEPVLSWKTCITHVKDVPAGEGVSYGLRYVTERPARIATLPVGYGDGYLRAMSGKAEVLVHGRRVPQVGTICMDQCMCDVSLVPEAAVGDEVVLIGRQGGSAITADDLAAWAGTISYEVLLDISARVPRVYTE